jgi:hypothetical protein
VIVVLIPGKEIAAEYRAIKTRIALAATNETKKKRVD